MSIPRALRSLLAISGTRPTRALYYVAPFVNWSLDWDAYYITRNVQSQFGLEAKVIKSARKLSNQIVHYGSLWDILANLEAAHTGRNFTVGTIFHGQKENSEFQDALGAVLAKKEKLAKLHTASKIMEERFLMWGVPREKLVRIPLGVDLNWFRPALQEERQIRRRELGIPHDAFCIGSFHKDGQGMGEGNVPKTVKAPEVLIDVLARLHKSHNIFVVLSAPARGFVKKGLEAAGVPYRHVVEKDYYRIPRLFHAIDLYLLTSREEGGPKGVLEALASGVPFVGTKVGLVPDVITHGINGLLAEVDDSAALAEAVARLIEESELRRRFIHSGLEAIQAYSWPAIAASYYREIYAPFLTIAQ
jgi:glycosyltransferase involved in cell wall biosynthesis